MHTIHDKILKKAYEHSVLSLNMSFNIETGEELQLYKNAARELYQYNLIDFEGDNTIRITPLGKKTFIGSGITKFVIDLDKRDNEIRQKEYFDFQVSRFQAKSRYFPYIVSVASIIIALMAYFKPIKSIENKQLLKGEILHIIDSISTSNQTKTVDSLHTSKTQVNSLN